MGGLSASHKALSVVTSSSWWPFGVFKKSKLRTIIVIIVITTKLGRVTQVPVFRAWVSASLRAKGFAVRIQCRTDPHSVKIHAKLLFPKHQPAQDWWGYIGIMEKKMEATISYGVISGLYRDDIGPCREYRKEWKPL